MELRESSPLYEYLEAGRRTSLPERLYRAQYNFPASVISNTVDIETQDAFGVPNSHAELLEAVQRAATNTFNREGPFLLAVATRELAEEMALTSEHSEVITIHTGFMERRSLFKLSVLTEPLGMSISGDAELAAKKEKCGWLILHRVPWEAVGLRADRAQIERGRGMSSGRSTTTAEGQSRVIVKEITEEDE